MGMSPDGLLQGARTAKAHAAATPLVAGSGAGDQREGHAAAQAPSHGHAHLDELDRLRVLTALSVVAVHVLALSAFLDRMPLAVQVQNGFVTAFHFTREVFLFVTALALVYTHHGKPFNPSRFWQRRGIGVLLPYVFWSVVYVALTPPSHAPLLLLRTLVWDLLTGSASYQLYYILLTLQFYLLLPWFLRVLHRVEQHPWTVLGISFGLQIGLLLAVNALLRAHPWLPGSMWSLLLPSLFDRLVLIYQFYIVLGAIVALHMGDVRAFLQRHGTWVIGVAIAALVGWELRYLVAIRVEHSSITDAVRVLQPGMTVYSTAVIGFLYWVASRQLGGRQRAAPHSQPTGYVWSTMSNASFGIYLVHPLFLSAVLFFLVPHLASWPVAALVPLIWLLTVAGATTLSVLLLGLPGLSRLVGRPRASIQLMQHTHDRAALASASTGYRDRGNRRTCAHGRRSLTSPSGKEDCMDPINVQDYEELARACMDAAVWDTYAQGSGDDVTLRANRTAFEAIRLRPRVLVDVRECDVSTTVLGSPVRLPVLIAPTSVHQLAHPEGECATARAAAAEGTVMVASTLSSYPLEAIAATRAPLWFQLYLYRDRRFAREFLQRVEAAGYRAVVLTVDAPAIGNRERDRRNAFSLPGHLRFGNFAAQGGEHDETPARASITWETRGERLMLTWEDIPWLRSLTALPLVLKGIMTAEDATRAVACGVEGIIVSNHGGRQLDGTLATIEALPEVVAAVDGHCEVYVDGGVRRGTDVLRALALGARAVLIGRPVIWGLASRGEVGVRDVLRILRDELTLAMALAGRPSLESIDRSLIWSPRPMRAGGLPRRAARMARRAGRGRHASSVDPALRPSDGAYGRGGGERAAHAQTLRVLGPPD
jgi:4-hydroxymandelate oxidase